MANRDRVLVVEDDRLTRTMIRTNLHHEGYDVTAVESAEEATELLAGSRFDVVVLDYMLPGASGLDALTALRRDDVVTPVLMLTARSETSVKVEALDRGADDYLTKPFHVDELVARVRAMVRRARAPVQTPSGQVFPFGAATVDLVTRTLVTVDGHTVRLGEKEVGLIALFQGRPRAILSRADILDEVWGMDANPIERTVDNYVGQLRRHVEPDPERPRHVVTVRGEGYQYLP
jgi:two-component system response regulator MprA